MKVYGENGRLLLGAPDLTKGWLESTKRLVRHHLEQLEQHHLEELPDSDGLQHLVIDQPARSAWDEYEDVQVYHPYTSEELAERSKPTLEQQVDALSDAVLELMLKGGGTNV